MREVVDDAQRRPLPVHYLAFIPSNEHSIEYTTPQASGKCTGASLIEPESFKVHNVEDRGVAKAHADGHSPPDTSIPAFGNLKMQTSEACHKSYAIFDHCEGKNTVIVHPSWSNSFPYQSFLEPGLAREAKCFISGLQAFNNKSVETMLGFRASAGQSPVGIEVPAHSCLYRGAMENTMQVQQRITLSNKAKCSVVDFAYSRKPQNLKKDIMESGFFFDVEEESQKEFHENTDEINALLSSDDELSSTGHSPNDASSKCSAANRNDRGSKISGKKRSPEDTALLDEVDDDADSGLGKCASVHTFLNCRRFRSWLSLHLPCENDNRDAFSGVEASSMLCRGKKSSANDVSVQVIGESSDCESKQSSGTFREGGLVDTSKRIKIKNNVQQLKNVIPGGDGLDTAGVLGRTIQYVKCLEDRLRELEAAREFQRPKKQRAELI